MTPGSRVMFCAFVLTGALITRFALPQTSEPEGHVTAIFHDVQLLPEQADARPAAINDKVDDGTALRTGDDSRSELTFADLTITRLGANTVFSFNKAGRSVRLDSGAILLYARKNSGGAQISTKAVSVGITGTTVILESRVDSYDRLIVLEGDARFSLNNFPDQATDVRAGQLLNVRAGSKKLPKPGRVDLRRIMKTHPLLKNFPPLPSLDLILAVADGRNPNRPPPQPQPPIAGTGSQGGPSPVYVPNPTGSPLLPSPRYWSCINGQVVQVAKADCEKGDGQCYASEQEARSHCGGGGTWWCCIDGKVVQIPQAQDRVRGNQCYRSREEALAHCDKLCWVCIDGKVTQVQEAEARARRAQCYGSEEEARAHCNKGKTCWCCINGQVVQTTEADCQERDGRCYGSRKEALKSCRGAGQTPTPTFTPHRPQPTLHPTPSPTQKPTRHRPDYPSNSSNPTLTPTKKFPPIKRATPTPTPGQTIR
jgi:hypothetical protein